MNRRTVVIASSRLTSPTYESRSDDDNILPLGLLVDGIGIFGRPQVADVPGVFSAANRDDAGRSPRGDEELRIFDVGELLRHHRLIGEIDGDYFSIEHHVDSVILGRKKSSGW